MMYSDTLKTVIMCDPTVRRLVYVGMQLVYSRSTGTHIALKFGQVFGLRPE